MFESYDKDGSGFIEGNEVAGFLTLLLKQAGVDHEVGNTEAKFALKAVDKDGDGKLSKGEVKMCIGIHE